MAVPETTGSPRISRPGTQMCGVLLPGSRLFRARFLSLVLSCSFLECQVSAPSTSNLETPAMMIFTQIGVPWYAGCFFPCHVRRCKNLSMSADAQRVSVRSQFGGCAAKRGSSPDVLWTSSSGTSPSERVPLFCQASRHRGRGRVVVQPAAADPTPLVRETGGAPKNPAPRNHFLGADCQITRLPLHRCIWWEQIS